MGESTGISWCHHTFNPWWGCVEVSPACDFCYARGDSIRYGHAVWGKDAARRFFGEQHWNEPLKWNRKAESAGERRRVFCASMADVCEERTDAVGEQMQDARDRLDKLIAATPWLDWLLLTKRPASFLRVFRPSMFAMLPNVWPGVTVENADYVWRIDELLRLPSNGPKWISYEPVLGPVDFGPWITPIAFWRQDLGPIKWIIVGAESRGLGLGRYAEEYAATARAVITQGRGAGVAMFHKQMPIAGKINKTPAAWPIEFQVQDVPR